MNETEAGLAPTGRVALVFTDVEGSTERWEREGVAFAPVLEAHNSLMRALLAENGGYEVKTEGDAFMIAFSDAAAAVRFCAAAQAQLAGVRVRMGAHVGSPLCRIDPTTGRMDYFGPVVNKAARVASAAHGGQVLVSREIREEARGAVAGPWIDLGEHLLKGLEGRHGLWQLGDGAFPRIRTIEVRRTNLPPRLDLFVGREEELAAIGRRFAGGCRLLTVVGAGGMGKTRLAQRFAADALGELADSAWFADLSAATSVEGVCQAVAEALDVPLGKEPIQQLGWAIAGRGRALLVLDNLEQVVAHAPKTVSVWAEMAPRALFLTTSRAPLRLRGEQTLGLEPLGVKEGAALFADRSPVEVTDEAAAEELVRRLDGLPLAIELAAARTRALSPRAILDRLHDRFRLLAGPRGDRPGRHSTLRAALEWSWDLLSADEQAALSQLSVFEGGFTLDAAEAVAQVEGFVLDVVQALIEHSLLRVDPRRERYAMLASVQAFASEKLGEGRADAEARHGACFARLGQRSALEALSRRGGVERLQALVPELDNLVAACERALARRDDEIAAGCALAAAEIYKLRGPFSVGAALLGRVAVDRGELRRAEGDLWYLAGRPAEAEAALGAALALARQAGDGRLEGDATNQLGKIKYLQSQREEARALYEAALVLHRRLGNRPSEANALSDLGSFQLQQGRPAEARALHEAALAIHRELGNRLSEANVLSNLGVLHRSQGNLDEAREVFEAALVIHRQVGNRYSEAVALGNLGNVYRNQGRMEEAKALYEEALALHRQVGNRTIEATVLGNLGNVYLYQGRLEEGRALYDRALAIHRQIGDRPAEGIVLNNLGILYRDQGQAEEARAHLESALALAREVRFKLLEGTVLRELGVICLRGGDLLGARLALEQSEPILREGGFSQELGLLLAHRAQIHRQEGDLDGYRAALAEARSLAQKLGAGSDLGKLLAEVEAT